MDSRTLEYLIWRDLGLEVKVCAADVLAQDEVAPEVFGFDCTGGEVDFGPVKVRVAASGTALEMRHEHEPGQWQAVPGRHALGTLP